MRPVLKAAAIVGASLVITASLIVWLGLRSSLAQLDGTVEVAGITAPIVIERDEDGIPTITALDRDDLAFATGFAHAQDRFFQMDLLRRQAAGELSEIFGERAVAADKRLRFHRFRARAQRVLARASSRDRGILGHYAAGVNAGLETLGASPRRCRVPWRRDSCQLDCAQTGRREFSTG